MGLKLGITMLIHNKNDIEFVTEFPCFLGHPVDLKYLKPLIKCRHPTKSLAHLSIYSICIKISYWF